MAAQSRWLAPLLVVVGVISCCTVAVQATDYTVGDADGWTKPNGNSIPDGYLSTWAMGKTFSDGDNLIFNYNPIAHTVLLVTESDYAGCVITSPLVKHATGADTIKLAAGTTYYFICGTGGHCDAGQKLTVTTAGTSAPPKSAAAGGRTFTAAASLAAAFAAVATIALC